MKRKKGVRIWGGSAAAVLLACSVGLAGCTSGNGGSNQGGAGTGQNEQTNETSSGTNEERMSIDWMNIPSDLSDESYALNAVEEAFNVDIQYNDIPRADYVQKQQIVLTSGEVPDVMYVLDPNQLFKYVQQGLVAEVPVELIEAHMPGVKQALDSFAPQAWYYTKTDDRNYGIPLMYYNGQFNAKSAWRTDLLEEAGVEGIPQTLDEMEAAFEKLKQIGVYGMNTNGNSYYYAFFTIFGAYGVMPPQWMVKDGKVVNAAIQPEAREALERLADWYSKGYIDPEFVTGKELEQKFVEGKFAYNHSLSLNAFDESNPNSTLNAIKAIKPDGMMEMTPLPVGAEGQQGGWAWGSAGSIYAFGKHLEDEPEKMARIMEMMEQTLTDPETFMQVAVGEEGTHWEYNNPDQPGEGLTFIPPFDDSAKLATEGLKNSFESIFAGMPGPDVIEPFLGARVVEDMEQYNAPVWDIFGKPDVLPSAGKYWGDLTNLKTEVYAQIVRGDKTIEEFDAFVKQWNELGGAELEAEANELYQSVARQ
ncbi:extracellular solute-binding protein [Paenibacillus sp. IB182496]|uniref:Extracellular solute-binding protein n=1 Tax=Paenibacillus sabuli TaxID=2772509 RepID=A0A927GU11_9BACL|nr:extracellular solute-binding protein [Paenibacillus sabuli]MBD2847247.1 extracellular solute-binding protein [Paenibacillus sabuli]